MKKIFLCKKCHSEQRIWSMAQTRLELSKEKGDVFMHNCKKCGRTDKYSVYDVTAERSILIESILLALMFAVSITLGVIAYMKYWGKSFYSYSIIPLSMCIPSVIYLTYIRSQNEKIHLFNRS